MGTVTEITKNDLIKIIEAVYQKIDQNKEYLSNLDTQIGDGDHGFSMAGGFKSFYDNLQGISGLDIGQVLKKGGFELIKKIGGAAGAVFGTFFTGQASYYEKNLSGKESLSLQDWANMLAEALAQIKKRGNAKPGDKTMIDAMQPAVEALQEAAENDPDLTEAFKKASMKAKQGAESTKNMVSKRGRSRNLGERSKGYLDAGAMSTFFIFDAISEYLQQKP
ncbi:MAG: dihydroxyacetone kinase subunit DhaL [Spirochaetota bacterium]